MSFETLKLRSEVVRALKEQGIDEPTSIQEKAIPLALAGKDVIGISKTGSGKTIAFGVPVVERVKPRAGLQVLILAPTRELAVQISQELTKLGSHLGLRVATVFGGVSFNPQVDQLARCEIAVATPGRMRDHLNQRTVDLSKISCFVLDEADKMVEMGFIEDITDILDYMPSQKQILLFGATISSEIDTLKNKYMNAPTVVEAESLVKEDFLEQYYYNLEPHQKFSYLVHLLKKEDSKLTIIFCSARSTVEIVTKNLRNQGIKAEMIHGKMTQNRRLHVIENFVKGRPHVLVASAVAARGLDIKNVSHVINYDLSQDPQEYVHRVGRTARAGASGKAITLLSPKDHDTFRQVLGRYDMKVEELALESFEKLRFETARREPQRFGSRHFGGDREERDRSHVPAHQRSVRSNTGWRTR